MHFKKTFNGITFTVRLAILVKFTRHRRPTLNKGNDNGGRLGGAFSLRRFEVFSETGFFLTIYNQYKKLLPGFAPFPSSRTLARGKQANKLSARYKIGVRGGSPRFEGKRGCFASRRTEMFHPDLKKKFVFHAASLSNWDSFFCLE